MEQKIKPWIRNILIITFLAIFVLGACAPAAMNESRELQAVEKGVEGAAPIAPAEEPAASAFDSGVVPEQANQAGERIVIKNANLTVVVPDPSESMTRISNMAEEMGGFVVSANMYKQQLSNGIEVPRVSIVVRVPAEKLNEALELIRSESDDAPQNESLSSEDVTSSYVDLQSRLKNLEAAEAQLTEIMQDARRTEDVLAVYSQLVQTREQIEVIKGQIKYYEESARFSSISAELIADAAVQPIEIGGWKPEGVARQAIESLLRTMQFLVSALIWIVIYMLPVLLVLFVIFILPPVLIFRSWRKRRLAKKVEQKAPEAN
jgi:hypothetical protein